jgi:hypothetical protein
MKENILTRHTKMLLALVALSVAILIISNLASTKITGFGPAVFDAGTILFPFAYIITGIITEVYGSSVARWTVLLGLGSILLMSAVLLLVQVMPIGPGYEGQASYENVLGFVPRIALASLVAYFVGEMLNIHLMTRLRKRLGTGRLLVRLVSSSGAGELLDTVTFSVIAFWGTMASDDLGKLIVTVYLIKLGFDIVLAPFTTRFIRQLTLLKADQA